MRLHRLEIEAFGPFAGRQVIELDELGDAGLFLISGATGAGKTSLLDAVAFALFGRVAGVRSHKTLKSQHADPAATPEVLLEVTLRGRRWRIRRTPSFARPGRKTLVQASVTLDERVDGQWVHQTGRLDEAGRVLEDVLGMTADQFHRVVVLPQGDFAAFLHADNDERGALLRRLFDVQTFADVETWLAEERRRTEQACRDADRVVSQLRDDVARVVGAAPPLDDAAPAGPAGPDDAPPAEADWAQLPPAALVSALSELEEHYDAAVTLALRTTDDADSSLASSERAHVEGGLSAASHDRGVEARARLAALVADEAQHSEREAALDRHERAARVLLTHRALERADQAVARAGELYATRLASAPAVVRGVAGEAIGGWRDALAACGDEVEELCTHDHVLREALAALPRLVESAAAAETALAQVARSRPEVEDSYDTAQAELHAARAAHDAVPALADVVRELTTVLETREALDRLVGEGLPSAQSAAATARDRAQDLRGVHQDLLQVRLDDMAGELAAQLVDGDRCRVCGSTDHPHPAPGGSGVGGAELSAAADAWRAAETERSAREETLRATRERITALEQQLADERRAGAVLAGALEERAAALAAARAGAADLPRAEQRVGTVLTRRAELDADESRHRQASAAATARHDEVAARVARVEDDLRGLLEEHDRRCPCAADMDLSAPWAPSEPLGADEDADDGAGVATAALLDLSRATVEQHRSCERAVRDLLSSAEVLAQTEVLREAARAERDEAMAADEVDDLDVLPTWLLGEGTRTQTSAAVEAYRRERRAAEDVLAEADVAAALVRPRPDLLALDAARSEARQRWQQAHRALSQTQHAAGELARVSLRLRAAVDELGPLAERRDVVVELADLATGRGEANPDGISLTTYVLATRLERIVALANERLSTMADARYELAVDHGRDDRRSRGGLGLLVLDHWTGEHRPATTLSGGETFMVSLALALGTADAVREESGGVDLQTLFIDEGFGSLDDAALEQVMDVLDALRAGGRAVGVISHVADMRHRIPAQLRVTKTSTGSSTSIVTDVEDAA